ncbi:AMP-dependent synthetase/ligase [Nocardia inohanensis]|uniref:AMP-dependent synthetase/ligase n=1 Tax=Nocardia inohanensis TaxID=209246 RepID=UPI00082A25C9|nr:AMP-dependent synthetase/ligase [Nocardia inohanensis]
MSDPRTFPEAFQRTVAAYPGKLALRTPGDEITYTWREYGDAVHRIAGGFAALGVGHGDTVAAMLTNRPEFHLTETAASHLGATTFSIYNTNPAEQIRYLLDHSGAKLVVTERQFLDAIKSSGTVVEHIVVVDDGDLDRLPQPDPAFDFEAAWRAVEPADVLCMIYTSGTTGKPKGVEHTHEGMFTLGTRIASVLPMREDDTTISYLPAAHAADRGWSHYFAMWFGYQVTDVADPAQLPAAILELHPTTLGAVPRTWEKFKMAVDAQLGADPQLAAALAAGVPEVAAAVRARLGLDRLRWSLTGAAPIATEVFDFLRRLDIPISEVWGMSECGLGTAVSPAQSRLGTVGKALPGVELRTGADGELLMRAKNLMRGYRNDPAKTAEAIDAEGWLHTGDLAHIDDDGYVRIIGRKKELIINAAGKNMSPGNIENAIVVGSPLIGSVIAIGDRRPYNVALITLDPEIAPRFAADLGLAADPAVLAADERVHHAIAAAVEAGNAKLARVEQVRKFTVLPVFWLPGGDELTPTLKLKREPIAAKYAAEIDALYQGW